jgi:DNA-binding NarL/FixJ family response regulator
MQTITIVLADDHQILRQGVHALLDSEQDLDVVGDADDGLEAIRLVDSLQPDVLVVDMQMDGMNGIDVTRKVRESSPKTKVIILSMHSNDAYVIEALNAGARAYVIKESGIEELIRAIHLVVTGKTYLSRPLSWEAIESYGKRVNATEMETPGKGNSKDR